MNEEAITDEDYEHAQKVWKEFNIKSFREYHNLYNISDILLLADVFENFRDVRMKNYNLDPAWYYTAPGLAWDASLKLTKVELELLGDINMFNKEFAVELRWFQIDMDGQTINIWEINMIVVNLQNTYHI